MKVRGIRKDGTYREIAAAVEKEADHICVTVSADADFGGLERVEVDYCGIVAAQGDDGYMVLPRAAGCDDYCLSFFSRHPDAFETELAGSSMPLFGVKSEKYTFLAVISGMPYDYTLKISGGAKGFCIYPVFDIYGQRPYENIRVEYFLLSGENANYSGMARRYRAFKEAQGELTPLSERITRYETLAYAADSVLIRVRCGWKPAPSPVLHQTPENEPEMRVACDFARVEDILDELKAQGVDKAEICLVGWNIRGHDGRWPQAFPVEEKLGGEKGLRRLIGKAQSMGYQITCHTNSTEQYEISSLYDPQNTRLDREKKPVVGQDLAWSGGQVSQLCPRAACRLAEDILPKVAELGFHGTHYIDVIGVVPPRPCYHEAHPVHTGGAATCMKYLCDLSRRLFGGISSEGAYDFIAPYLDYGLYISFSFGQDSGCGLCDKPVPFWQLVYHGYVLSNPYSRTVNATLKDKKTVLKMIEYGGRPSYYFYSAFMEDENNWMGKDDAVCDTDSQLRETVSKIRDGAALYGRLSAVHTAFMENHEEVAENVYEVTYSDGTVIRVDYNLEEYKVLKKPANKIVCRS